uniref:Uncharacterized protein n=1 Tax=Brassica campestris TaxID=3711 RepID=A0A3P6BUY3_BRACM|nr:unnamed protein product [Brassica rapa]
MLPPCLRRVSPLVMAPSLPSPLTLLTPTSPRFPPPPQNLLVLLVLLCKLPNLKGLQ